MDIKKLELESRQHSEQQKNLQNKIKRHNKKQEEIASHVYRAISACEEDSDFSNVKQGLFAVLNLLSKNADKKNSKVSAMQSYIEEAKKKNQKWMDLIKSNLKIQLPEVPEEINEINKENTNA